MSERPTVGRIEQLSEKPPGPEAAAAKVRRTISGAREAIERSREALKQADERYREANEREAALSLPVLDEAAIRADERAKVNREWLAALAEEFRAQPLGRGRSALANAGARMAQHSEFVEALLALAASPPTHESKKDTP